MRDTYTAAESPEWKHARRAAFVQDVLASFSQRPAYLLSFEQVSQRLQLSDMQDQGIQTVPLDDIVGSAGRYADFTRAFGPRQDHLQERWQRIERLVSSGHSMPPIELYKVGQAYFVRDGNHRVSVARQYRQRNIQAKVWEFETDIPFEPDADIDALLGKSAYAAFVERTHFDRLCPGLYIELTHADGYVDLLAEIEAFQLVISEIDGREVPFEEAVQLWGTLCYTPIVHIIRDRRILGDFPGRTEADLYLWLCRSHEELQARHEQPVMMQATVDDLAARYGERTLAYRVVQKTVGWTARAVLFGARAWRGTSRRVLWPRARKE